MKDSATNLVDDLILSFAKQNFIDPKIIYAILCVENSSRLPFDDRGRPVIRFELHQFYKYLGPEKLFLAKRYFLLDGVMQLYTFDGGKRYEHIHKNQETENVAFAIARTIDCKSALLSTSFGVGQIMGFNHVRAGFDSVEEMYESSKTELGQYQMMLAFISSSKKLIEAIREVDLETIAIEYNGSGNVATYVRRLSICLSKGRF